jgi:hypothetical protein
MVGPHPGLLVHRPLGGCPAVRQPGPVRFLCRGGTRRTVLGWTHRPSPEPSGQPTAQPCHARGGHLPDPPEGLGGQVYFEKKVTEGKTKREEKRERLVACVVGSAPWRPALRRSHFRTHRNLRHLCTRRHADLSRPETAEISLLTQRGFGRDHRRSLRNGCLSPRESPCRCPRGKSPHRPHPDLTCSDDGGE